MKWMLALTLSLLATCGIAAAQETERTVLEFYDVADLTGKMPDFIGPNLELGPAGMEIDESRPFSGAAREGDSLLYGGVEDLLDSIFANVEPEAWGELGIGCDVVNEHCFTLVAPPALQEKVRAFLSALRRDLVRMVTVEVRLLEVDPGWDPKSARLTGREGLGLLARAEQGDGVKLVCSARVSGFDGRLASLYRGRQQAFVQDYDVEVAEGGASISDPILNVLNMGLRVDVRPTVLEREVALDIATQLCTLQTPFETHDTASGLVEVPDVAFLDLSGVVTVPDGGFALMTADEPGASVPFVLLVSARTERIPYSKDQVGRVCSMPVAPGASSPELRRYLVGDLARPVPVRPGPSLHLSPYGMYGFDIDEDEMWVVGGFEGDPLSDFLRDNVLPESWEEDGRSVRTRSGTLWVRQTPEIHSVIASVLEKARAVLMPEVVVKLRLLRASDAELRRILDREAALLGEEQEARLGEAIDKGSVKVVRRALISCANGQRVSLADVGLTTYVADYDVEITDGSTIADPIVMVLRHGFVADVRPRLAGGGSVVVLEARVCGTRLLRPFGSFTTSVGEVQTPQMEQQNVRTTVAVPVGGSVVIGGFPSRTDGDTFVVLATPKVVRR